MKITGGMKKALRKSWNNAALNPEFDDAISRLPEKFHTAVILSYFDELSLEEIAQIEDCPVGTVKSRVFRGKQILRQILEKENML